MEILTKLSWGLLALVHAGPAFVFFRPSLAERLYGAAPDGDIGLLIVHRGALFLGIVAICLYALADASARRAASLVVAISVIGFLVAYWRGVMPAGPLRTIALADLAALAPLALVALRAWRS